VNARILLIPACLAALAVGACGGNSSSSSVPNPNAAEKSPPGDIPDNQVYVRYHPPGAHFSVKVPEGWGRSNSNGTVTFTDKLNRVAMAEQPASSKPPGAPLARAGQTAYRTKSLAKAPPDPVTGKATTDAVERYVFDHAGHRLVLTLSGPKGADNVDPWRIISDSVRWSG
jgi:hypothetical protein